MKKCKRCGLDKEDDSYKHKTVSYKDGEAFFRDSVSGLCKECRDSAKRSMSRMASARERAARRGARKLTKSDLEVISWAYHHINGLPYNPYRRVEVRNSMRTIWVGEDQAAAWDGMCYQVIQFCGFGFTPGELGVDHKSPRRKGFREKRYYDEDGQSDGEGQLYKLINDACNRYLKKIGKFRTRRQMHNDQALASMAENKKLKDESKISPEWRD